MHSLQKHSHGSSNVFNPAVDQSIHIFFVLCSDLPTFNTNRCLHLDNSSNFFKAFSLYVPPPSLTISLQELQLSALQDVKQRGPMTHERLHTR